MMRIRVISFFSIFVIMVICALLGYASNSAPSSSTDAPGEITCNTPGCHESYGLNSGRGLTTLSMINGPAIYESGKTYTLRARIVDSGFTRYGFQVVALKDIDSSSAGTWSCTETSRTQVISGQGIHADRKYITYTFDGTLPKTAGNGEWTFDWIAPQQWTGDVSFYLAAVSADGDGTDLGDFCYTKKLSLSPISAIASLNDNKKQTYIYPNPVHDELNIYFSEPFQTSINFDIYSSSGQKMYSQNVDSKKFPANQGSVSLPPNLPQGVYFLIFTANGITQIKKFIKQ